MARNDQSGALRDALAAGFADVLGAQHVDTALQLWDRHFAHGKPHALIEYVNQLAAALMLPTRQRHELRMALYRSLLAQSIDPTRANAGTAPNRTAGDNTPVPRIEIGERDSNPAFRVFRQVALGVLQGVRADALGAVQIFAAALDRHASANGLDAGARNALARWVAGEAADELLQSLSVETYSNLAHLLYVAACEALGPVAADRLLSQSVRRAELLPEAAAFAPQRLL
jgi:hypothetical protein